jgi:hypothetical protein
VRKVLVPALVAIAFCFATVLCSAQTQQEKDAMRVATRDKLRAFLNASGPKKGINISFRQSEQNAFNFVGVKRDGLTNAEFYEVVVGVSTDNTVNFKIYPHYKGSYVNVDRAKDPIGLMRLMLNLNSHNFLYWGADDGKDIFAGFIFTLESGFTDKSMEIVLYSVAALDPYLGQMRPFIDASN